MSRKYNFLNYKYYVETNIGKVYIDEFDAGYMMVAEKENANILIHGSKKLMKQRLKELNAGPKKVNRYGLKQYLK